MSTLFWITIGMFIGWNLPQPAWARQLQQQIVATVKSLGNR